MKTITYILGFIIGVLIAINVNTCRNVKSLSNLNDNFNDTLRLQRNELNQQIASIGIIQSVNERLFLQQKTKDSTIVWLQKVVSDYKGKLKQAIVIGNLTNSIGAMISNVEITDTVKVDSLVYLYPTYLANWSNMWEVGKIIATKDSIFREIKISNEFEISLGYVNNGWFRKKSFDVIVKNNNPNTISQEVRAFSIQEKPKRFSLQIQAGINYNLKPYLGIGVGFQILGIK